MWWPRNWLKSAERSWWLMANIEITNIDTGSIALEGEEFRDEILTFAGADTFVKGTILARRAVALSVVASAVTGTGNGTVSAATVVEGPTVPLAGAYVLTVVTAAANGGTWKLVDPNGALITDGLVMTVGAGAATVFEAGGLRFTITDGATDFAAGDTATLTVTADGKLVPFAPGGGGGTQIPCAVLTYDVTKAGAGDAAIRALVKGVVNKTRLIIDADGSGVNVNAAVCDALRARGITPRDVQQLAELDNQ
jgi:hypothetical protein